MALFKRSVEEDNAKVFRHKIGALLGKQNAKAFAVPWFFILAIDNRAIDHEQLPIVGLIKTRTRTKADIFFFGQGLVSLTA